MPSPTVQPFEVNLRLQRCLSSFALLPAAMRGALRFYLYDILSHHRLSVLKHHKMPAKRGAQQMLATRTWRYTKLDEKNGGGVGSIAGMTAEGFVAAKTSSSQGGDYADDPDYFRRLEFGGTHRPGGLMAVPFMAEGLSYRGRQRVLSAFRARLKGRELTIINTPRTKGLLVEYRRGDREAKMWGVLVRSARVPAQLGYYSRWADILSRDVPRLEKAIDRAKDAAEVAGVLDSDAIIKAENTAYYKTFNEYLDAHPKKRREARKAADIARREARKDALAGVGLDPWLKTGGGA